MSGIFLRCALALVVCAPVVTPAQAADKPLDYGKRQTVKDVKTFLRQVEGRVELMEKASPAELGEMGGLHAKAAENLKFAETRLKKLDAAHAEVKPSADLYETLKARLAQAEKKMKAAQAAAPKDAPKDALTPADIVGGKRKAAPAVDAGEFKADFERLDELSSMFANPAALNSDSERAVELLEQFGPAEQEWKRLAKKYESLRDERTPEARKMQPMLSGADLAFGQFRRAVDSYVASAPRLIDQSIAQAMESAERGVADKKPAFFAPGGGIANRLAEAESRLKGLQAAAPDAAEAKQAEEKLAAARAKVAEMGKSLGGSTLEANRVPEERYKGADIDALREVLKQKWAKDGNGAELLKVGMSGKDWRRETKLEWSKGNQAFEKVDKSRVQGFVVVKHTDDVAAVHYVNIVKDHMAGDALQGYFVGSVKKEPAPEDLVMMKNVK